jgi:hypothetical protein
MQHAPGKMRNAYTILVGKPEGMTPLRRPKSRWENDKIDNRGNSVWSLDWINVAQDRGQ